MQFSRDSDVFDRHNSWQYRVIRASMATTTGAIVCAMLAKQPRRGPAFGQTADIALDGQVMTLTRKNGIWGGPFPIGTIAAVRDNVRRLADHCRLSDPEREALFEELRKWIRKDFRALAGQEA